MKRIIPLLLCFTAVLCLTACRGGTDGVRIATVESDIYSQRDISAAIDVIIDEFQTDWKDCTLLEIAYAGDERNLREAQERSLADGEEVIVLKSSYRKGFKSTPSLDSTSNTYELWCWTLVRTDGGQWKHIDHGYS